MQRKINIKRTVMAVFLVLVFAGLTGFDSNSVNLANASPKKKKHKMSPGHEDFYKYARYLFTKNERKIFTSLPTDEARDRFIQYFWDIRDSNPYTEENEFKIEIERRYEHVTKYLKEGPVPGWKSDRGRMYILLGQPTNWVEDSFAPGSEYLFRICWYWADSDIFACFVDRNGTGIYRMDLRNVSLKLLDELKKRKYHIANEDGKFETDVLDFDLSYDSKTNEILIEVKVENLSFEEAADAGNDLMTAKIKFDFIVYDQNDDFSKHTEVKTVKVQKDVLLGKKSTVTVRMPFALPRGKVKIDAIVSDFLGDAVHRKWVKIKN